MTASFGTVSLGPAPALNTRVVWCLQVLELVLPYVLDLNTLLICSTLSQQSKQLVQDAVRLNLARLVRQLPASAQVREMMIRSGCKTLGAADTEQSQLLWLCRMAGPAAIHTHHNACAVLWVVDNMTFAVDHSSKIEDEQRRTHCLGLS
jgi:hypothetical protein